MILTGGCQCGAKRYRVETESPEAYYCHCRMCQKAVGNVFAAFVNVPKAAVDWATLGPDLYHSSRLAERGFCARCGTPLSFAFPDSDRMDLTIGSLDDPVAVHPSSHFGIESRVPGWSHEDGLPGKRVDDSPEIVARWEAAYGVGTRPGEIRP
ncbi:GFA family protein [Parapedomonas caeni]|jgi:hypothetical protein